jgi:pimeloyl-ACP methyl ester carboxylesterase
MPILTIRDGEIYYELHGNGFPLMIFAPGGLRSELAFWRDSPSDPAVWMDRMALLGKKYRVVAMDQRRPGGRAPRSSPATTGISTHPITSRSPITLASTAIGGSNG